MAISTNQVVVTDEATLVFPPDIDGAYVHVKGGAASIYLGNSGVTITNGFELEQGEMLSLFIGPNEGLYAVCEEDTVSVCYIATLTQ